MIITLLYYGFKIIRRLIKNIRSKEIDYGDDIGITFSEKEDYTFINKDLLNKCKEIRTVEGIDKIVIFEGNIFLKQPTHQQTIRESIKEKIRLHTTNQTPIDNTNQIEQTVSYLLDQNLFM